MSNGEMLCGLMRSRQPIHTSGRPQSRSQSNQFSNLKPGTLVNSLALRARRVAWWTSVMQAIFKSMEPMGRPCWRRSMNNSAQPPSQGKTFQLA